METADLIRKVRKIEIKTRGLSNHLFSGEYHTVFKGRGMSFSEVRSYQYGDDVRNIDWNVTARTNDPHVKVFEEERELTVFIMVDLSGSAGFGSQAQTKREIMTEIAAVLAFSAINNNDKVGLICFSDGVDKFVPPKKGKQHILRIIRELLETEPTKPGTDLGGAIQFFNNLVKKRCITFIISDFMGSNYHDALRVAARRHDIIGIHSYDPFEAAPEDIGLVYATDPETGHAAWVDFSDKHVRADIKKQFDEKNQYFRDSFLKSGASVVQLPSNEPYVNALQRFFQQRKA